MTAAIEDGAERELDAIPNHSTTDDNDPTATAPRGVLPRDAAYLAGIGVAAGDVLDLRQVLAALRIGDDEHVPILAARQRPDAADEKRASVMSAAAAADAGDTELAEVLAGAWNLWFAPNTTTLPIGRGRRGTEHEVETVHAVYADLDVKVGACPDLAVAWRIIEHTSAAIGAGPTVVIYSGKGLQPLWGLAEGVAPDIGIPLVRRFGRLIRAVADEVAEDLGLPAIHTDSVFDAARVLRVPNSHNHKYVPALPVVAIAGDGQPLDARALDDALTGYAGDDDQPSRRDVQTPPEHWTFAAGNSCGYAIKTIRSWLTETPAARHPRALSWYTRLACMHAYGCLTARDHAEADKAIGRHFEKLLTQEPRRPIGRGEIDDLRGAGQDRASRKTRAELAAELGNHAHLMTDRKDPK
jgi:hypothetical protein